MLDDYPSGGFDFDVIRRMIQVTDALPIRFVAKYCVVRDSAWMAAIDLASYLVEPYLKVRTRVISGEFFFPEFLIVWSVSSPYVWCAL